MQVLVARGASGSIVGDAVDETAAAAEILLEGEVGGGRRPVENGHWLAGRHETTCRGSGGVAADQDAVGVELDDPVFEVGNEDVSVRSERQPYAVIDHRFVTDLIDRGFDDGGRLKRLLLHVIEAEDAMRELGVSSKLNVDWGFLQHLRDVGREKAGAWLAKNRRHLGKRSTVDLREMFL